MPLVALSEVSAKAFYFYLTFVWGFLHCQLLDFCSGSTPLSPSELLRPLFSFFYSRQFHFCCGISHFPPIKMVLSLRSLRMSLESIHKIVTPLFQVKLVHFCPPPAQFILKMLGKRFAPSGTLSPILQIDVMNVTVPRRPFVYLPLNWTMIIFFTVALGCVVL